MLSVYVRRCFLAPITMVCTVQNVNFHALYRVSTKKVFPGKTFPVLLGSGESEKNDGCGIFLNKHQPLANLFIYKYHKALGCFMPLTWKTLERPLSRSMDVMETTLVLRSRNFIPLHVCHLTYLIKSDSFPYIHHSFDKNFQKTK